MRYLFVHSFEFDQNLLISHNSRRDSGAWVLDDQNGTMYGHIVAGVPGSGNAFIVSAQEVHYDMESIVGPVKLVYSDVPELVYPLSVIQVEV